VDDRNLIIIILGDSTSNSISFAEIITKALPKSKISIATNTSQCIKFAKKHEPDVFLVDISMSKVDSLEISRIMKKELSLQTTPMLFITDLEEAQELRLKAIEAGAEGFIVKPIDDALLITQLKAMAKIKERNILISTQTEKLEALVKHRTSELSQEICERKKLEIELKRSEDTFRTYIKKAPIGIFVVNALGQYIEVNEMACQMMGRTKKEILNLSLIDYIVSDQVEKGLAGFHKLIDKGFLFEEYLVRKKDSEDYWISLFATKIDDNRFLAFCIDISERKFSARNLEQLSENLQVMSEELVKKNEKLLLRLQQTIDTISKIGEMKDAYTAGHQKRVALLSCAIAKEMKLSNEVIYNISIGALIHDIGKVNIPSDILNKPGKVSSLEYQILQSHVEHSYEIVKEIDFPHQVIEMIYQHHERLDGSGYPLKLTAESIITESRILAVADVVEAMMSHRPYRQALGVEAAINEITMHRGIKYDSKVVDACIKLFREREFIFF